MRLKICTFLPLIFLFCSFSTFKAKGENNVQFYNLNEEYGISIRETNSVCKDNYGFMWISSKMGIIRYTQDDIKIYQLSYEAEDIITVRLVFENDVLYAYTNNGQIYKYNSIKDKFEIIINISKVLKNPNIMINELLVDGKGKMWFGSLFGLFSYDKEEGLTFLGQHKNIHYIEWFDATRFFYVIDGEIILFNTLNLSGEDYFTFPVESSFFVSSMYYEHKLKRLWIGTRADGLLYLAKKNGKLDFSVISEIPHQPILAIEANSDSTMLIGIDGQGVWEINKYQEQCISVFKEDSDDPQALKGNGVYDIYCDANKRVWVCTYSGGVSYFDQANSIVTEINHIVNNQNSLVNNKVNCVLEDSDGKLWFATDNGISCWNMSTNRWRSFYHNNKEHAQVFHTLCEDDKGRIWAGTYSSGVYLLDQKSGKELEHYSLTETSKEFNINFVFDIYKDSQGNVWVGGVNGDLICYLDHEDRFVSFKNFTVKVIIEYRPGEMLIGTTFGLLLLDAETGSTKTLLNGYLVYDIILKNEVVWLCTSGNGLIRYNMKTSEIKSFTVDSGLPSNFVNSITFSKGFLWIGTEYGLCRISEDRESILTFNSLPVLSNISFNQNSHYTLKNGKLIWGTNKGAVLFDPDVIQPQKYEGKIFYQDLAVAGRSIRESTSIKLKSPMDSLQELSLKYFQNTISLELIPIGVSSPGSKFSWKLEGLDQEWSNPGNNRILSYSNVPSGTYSLRIRMFDNSLTNIISERSITLKIIPPFWATWWFRILAFAFLAGLVIFLLAYYVNRLKKQHSEDKIRFFANTAHDIRTSLTLIKGPIEELNKESGLTNKGLNYLHLATEQTHRLTKVVTQLMDFQKVDIGKERLLLTKVDIVEIIKDRVMMFEAFAKTKSLEIKFSYNCTKFVTAVDEGMIEKVIDNLISNAIKYSFPDSTIEIIVECSQSKWSFKVKDKGIGISKKAQRQLFNEFYRGDNAVNAKIVGSGIGLLLVKNYVNLHGGKVSCYSQLNIGSTFCIVLPLRNLNKDTAEKILEEETDLYQISNQNEMNSLTLSEVNSSTSPKKDILIVEDNEYLREFLKSAMETQFHVNLAEDGIKAWEIIKKDTPDLVISDIMMPNMDGYELCRKIKTTYETSHIPVILLTSLSGNESHFRGLGLGADDYLTKPFDVTLLQQRIKTIIHNRELIREKALKIIKHNEDDEAIFDNELNDQFVKKMVEVVRKNIGNSEFSKDDFAAALNVSPSLLYKKAKSLTNQSPTDFIKSIRLDYALNLINSKKYTITEISEFCGFSSVGYFSTVFRKHYGKSPTQIV